MYTFNVAVAPTLRGTVAPTGQVVRTDGSSTLATLNPDRKWRGQLFHDRAGRWPTRRHRGLPGRYLATTPSASSPVTVTVNAPTVQVTLGTTPTGVSFSVDGVSYTSSQVLTWTVGSTHTVATTSPQTSGGIQNTFASWSDAGALSHSVTAPASATSLTAAFSTAYQLTTAANPSGGATITPASGMFYPAGTVVNLTAMPNSSYSFSSWTGSVASTSSASTTITLSAPQSVTANLTALSAVAALSPSTLNFATVAGATSAAQRATLTNSGNASLAITGISLTGTGATSFAQTNTCGTVLAASANCTISITFSPSTAATYAASLSIADNATGSPQLVALTGTGTVAPSFTLGSANSSQTIARGGTATYTISVTPVDGSYSSPITLSASGVPMGATATFTPATLTPGSAAATSTLTIKTPVSIAGLSPWRFGTPALAALGLFFLPRSRRRLATLALLLFASFGAMTALSGCGGGFSISPAVDHLRHQRHRHEWYGRAFHQRDLDRSIIEGLTKRRPRIRKVP